MGRVYKKPPVIEAVCEFRFEPGQPWDLTIPGLIYERIKHKFPKKRQQNTLEWEVRAAEEGVAQKVSGGIPRMQFLQEDEKALIQVGPDLLALNTVDSYPTWDIFKGIIEDGLGNYLEVAKPKGLKRIGLRYINRIEIPKEQVNIEEYVLAAPAVPQSLPHQFSKWVQRVEIPYEDANGLLALQSGSIHEESRNVVFLLDLDFATLRAATVPLDLSMKWVEDAHTRIEFAFEACITDKARELFNAGAE